MYVLMYAIMNKRVKTIHLQRIRIQQHKYAIDGCECASTMVNTIEPNNFVTSNKPEKIEINA